MDTDTAHPQITALNGFRAFVKWHLVQAGTMGILDLETFGHVLAVERHFAYHILYLYVAALSTGNTHPPSLPLPHTSQVRSTNPIPLSVLNIDDCPLLIRPSVLSWSHAVPLIKSIPPPDRPQVARVACGLPSHPDYLGPFTRDITRYLCCAVNGLYTHGVFVGNIGTVQALWPGSTEFEARPAVGHEPHPAVRPKPAAQQDHTKHATRKGRTPDPEVPKAKKAVDCPMKLDRKKKRTVGRPRGSTQHTRPPPSPNRRSQPEHAEWSLVPPPGQEISVMSSLPPTSRPHIWTTSRDELCRIIPEYGRALNNIVYESFETPIVFIDGNAWQEDRWDGGKVIELSMVRESTRVLQDVLPASTDGDFQAISTETAAELEPQGFATAPNLSPTPWSEVVERNGLYVFAPEEEPYTAVWSGRGSPSPASFGSVVAFTPVANNQLTSAPSSEIRSRAPPEIEALLSSHTTRIPVSIVLCRTATLSPFLLRDNQGCVFLGFFMVADVQLGVKDTSLEVIEGQDRPTTLARSQNTWRFRFEWVPGGEGLNATTAPPSKPWWVDPAIDARRMTGVDSEEAGTPLLHPYTLLPLPFLATPAQSVCSDADVKAPLGWHCTSCGRLNLQQNLCYQKCGSCSTPNGLPAIPVEYVRQVRGTDPIAFPWDRYPASVACTSADAPEGLRRFSYAIDADVVVHHLFTRNRPEVQAEPTRLFSDLQTAVEVPAESGTARLTSTAGTYYSCRFGAAPPARTASQRNQRPFADIPKAVRRAGELMTRRAQLHSAGASANPTIDCVEVCAWRTAGCKKGCKLAAEAAPVVVLCLGADVELTFFHRQSAAADRAAPSATGGASSDMDEIPIDVLEEAVDESLSAPVQGGSVGAETGPSRKAQNANGQGTRSRAKSAKEVLMATLVHGDMLVVSGDVLEYSIKRTGMSIVLFGTR